MSTRRLALLPLVALTACRSGAPAERHDAPPPAPAAAPAASAATPATSAAPTRAPGAPLVFAKPAAWIAVEPTSQMRKAQYRLPHVAADAEDAECVVYYFGAGGGGGVDANVERWCSQFEQPDGRASKELVVRSERAVGGMPVHDVELGGTYVAETAPGSGERVNKPGYRMLASIVESDHGAYYVKLVGPAATVQEYAPAFRGFVDAIH